MFGLIQNLEIQHEPTKSQIQSFTQYSVDFIGNNPVIQRRFELKIAPGILPNSWLW